MVASAPYKLQSEIHVCTLLSILNEIKKIASSCLIYTLYKVLEFWNDSLCGRQQIYDLTIFIMHYKYSKFYVYLVKFRQDWLIEKWDLCSFWDGGSIIQASYNMTSRHSKWTLYRKAGELAKTGDDKDWSLGAQLLISVEVDPRLFLHILQRVRNIDGEQVCNV
jgi:hypothetical protein